MSLTGGRGRVSLLDLRVLMARLARLAQRDRRDRKALQAYLASYLVLKDLRGQLDLLE